MFSAVKLPDELSVEAAKLLSLVLLG
uniref:Uncharacterized protein n=1 Tax=Anguilla anguilla TaxID=7936 RepID=A0A0E9QPY6_ANGAN